MDSIEASLDFGVTMSQAPWTRGESRVLAVDTKRGFRRVSGKADTWYTYLARLLLTCVTASVAIAATDNLPNAGQIFDRYVNAAGGAAAWRSKTSERDDIEGRTLDGQRIVLRATVTLSRSGSSFSEIQIPQQASE